MRVVGGFESTEQYYRSQASVNTLTGLRVPLLSLNAEDDPITSSRCVPFHLLPKTSGNLIIGTTKFGGHLSWFEGFNPWTTRRWVRKPVRDFLELMIRTDPRARAHRSSPERGVEGRKPRKGDGMVMDLGRDDVGFMEVELGEGRLVGGKGGGETESDEVGAKDDGLIQGL